MAKRVQYASLKKAEVDLNATNKVIATLTRNESNKTIRVDIRHWYQPDDSVEFVPTSKGVSLPFEKAMILLSNIATWSEEKLEEVADASSTSESTV